MFNIATNLINPTNMGLLYPAQEKHYKGPWLIGSKELLELSKIIDPIKEHLKDARVKELKEEKKQPINDLPLPEVEIRVIDKEDKALVNGSMEEMLKDIHLDNIRPKGIEIEIYYDDNSYFELSIDNDTEDGGLYYEMECYDQKEMQEIAYLLKGWVNKYKPNKLKYLWGDTWAIVAFFAAISVLFFWTELYEEVKPTTKEYYKPQIEQIIKNGVNDSNSVEALDLLLKLSIAYTPSNVKSKQIYNPQNFRYIIYCLAILLLCIVRPITLIGLGRNKGLYSFYIWWNKSIYVLGGAIVVDQIIKSLHLQ